MWYLWALFWFSMITPLILHHINLNVLFALSLVICVAYMLVPLPSPVAVLCYKFQINRIIGFYPFFLLGMIMKKNGNIACFERNSKIIFTIVMAGYLLLCYIIEGLAYKGSFYLSPSSSCTAIFQQVLSYPIIMSLCITLVYSMPRKQTLLSKLGTRTLNVYLLHMLVVFPLCYGVFSHLSYNIWYVITNSVLACCLCSLFFSATVDRGMKRLLSTPKWAFAVFLYIVSLAVVNNHFISKFI